MNKTYEFVGSDGIRRTTSDFVPCARADGTLIPRWKGEPSLTVGDCPNVFAYAVTLVWSDEATGNTERHWARTWRSLRGIKWMRAEVAAGRLTQATQ